MVVLSNLRAIAYHSPIIKLNLLWLKLFEVSEKMYQKQLEWGKKLIGENRRHFIYNRALVAYIQYDYYIISVEKRQGRLYTTVKLCH